jgi:transcriptional regulator GlxA family with amidase domain
LDDCPAEFGRRIRRASAHGVVTAVLAKIRANRGLLPQPLNAAISALFSAPERFFDAVDVANLAGISRRSLDRHLIAIGFSTARRLVIGAKVLHGAVRLSEARVGKGRTIRSVSDGLGYADPEVFSRQYAEVFGTRPTVGAELEQGRIVAATLSYLCPVVAPSASQSPVFYPALSVAVR